MGIYDEQFNEMANAPIKFDISDQLIAARKKLDDAATKAAFSTYAAGFDAGARKILGNPGKSTQMPTLSPEEASEIALNTVPPLRNFPKEVTTGLHQSVLKAIQYGINGAWIAYQAGLSAGDRVVIGSTHPAELSVAEAQAILDQSLPLNAVPAVRENALKLIQNGARAAMAARPSS